MAVIYEDQTQTGMGGLVNALGQALSSGVEQQVTSHYLDLAKNMDPQSRTTFLTSKLGPKGAALAEQLTQSQMDTATLKLDSLKTIDQQYQNQLDQVNAENAPEMAKLAKQIDLADIAAKQASLLTAKAGAAADYASAAAAAAEAQNYKVDSQIKIAQFNNMAGLTKSIMALVTDPDAAPDLLSNDPHIPAGNNGAPMPQTPGAPSQKTEIPTLIQQGKTVLNLSLGNASPQDLYAAFPPDKPPTPSALSLLGAAGDAAKGDLGKVAQDMQPVSVVPTMRGNPAVIQNLATNADGQSYWVGRPRYMPKPTPEQFNSLADGVSAWQATTGALALLSQPGTLKPQILRKAANLLSSAGIDLSVVGTDQAAMYNAALAHAAIAAQQLSTGGGRSGVTYVKMIQATLPTFTDAPDIRAAKLNAANALLASIVKPVVGNLSAEGYVVPPSIADFYKSEGLDKKSMVDLSKDYVGFTGGQVAPDDSDAGTVDNAGDGSVNSAADGGEDGGGSPDASGAGGPSTPSGNANNSPVTISNENEYNALPPGATYIFNGKQGVKGGQ